MSHSHTDPDADPSRRAWLACPNCDHGAGCAECRSRRNCDTHWQYLLKNTATRVFLQCPTCYCVWTADTSKAQEPTVVRKNTRRATEHREDAVVANVRLGDSPGDIVTSPNGELVYVMTADSVTVVNRLHHVVGSIPVDAEPKRMMLSADGNRLYVTGYDGALSIVDPIAMATKAFVKQRNTAAAASPDGEYIYCAHADAFGDRANSWVSVIRADGAAVAFAAVDGFITGMAVSPNGRRLYVASAAGRTDERGGIITIIDTADYKTVDSVAIDEAPDTISADAEGLLYVTHFHANSVSVIDPGTHCGIMVALDDAPMEAVARPRSEFVYTANAHSVTMIDTTTATATSLMVGELPRRLALSADGRRLYATDFAHGTVWCLDTADNSVVATVSACAHPAAMALSPDGELLYVTDTRAATLTVISTAALKPTS